MVASGNASYTEMFNTGPGSLYFSGPNGRVIVTQSQDGNTFLNPATGAWLCTLLMQPRHLTCGPICEHAFKYQLDLLPTIGLRGL